MSNLTNSLVAPTLVVPNNVNNTGNDLTEINSKISELIGKLYYYFFFIHKLLICPRSQLL